jgi:hypothetical protein
MTKITKILLVVLSSISLSFAAVAGELSVTGAAKASYVLGGADEAQGKGLGVSNELNAIASGEMDNGWTWSYSTELDPGDGGAASNDDSQLTLTMGDMGTIGFFDSEGGLSQELGYGIGALGTGTDWGNTMTVVYGLDVSSHPNAQYHIPADLLPYGIAAKIGFAPNMTDGQGNSFKNSGPINPTSVTGQDMTGYMLSAAPIDGLKIGADFHTTGGNTGVQKAESGNAYAQYAMGNFKVGYNRGGVSIGLQDKNGAITGYENRSLGIEMAVNDALSISYTDEESERFTNVAIVNAAAGGVKTKVTAEMETFQVAYIFGGATVGLAVVDVENADYTALKEEKKTIFSLAMDF